MISAVPCALSVVAVIVAAPSATPRTTPDPSTVATEMSFDDQVNSAPTRCPFRSYASAAKRSVSPGAMVSTGRDTTTEPAACDTITAARPTASPAVAVIVAIPLPAAVTTPDGSTTATSVSPLAHATRSPSIRRPIWSRTSAMRRTVSLSAVNSRVSGVTATVVGTDASTSSSARPTTPAEVAVTSISPAPTPVTSPAASTMATASSLDAQENSAPAIT